MGAEQRGSPLCPVARGERWEKMQETKTSAACDSPGDKLGEPRGLASSAGVWGEPTGLCPAAPQGGTRCYPANLLP